MIDYLNNSGVTIMQQFLRNVLAKFKVNSLSPFCREARFVFSTQKLFPSKIFLTIEFAKSIAPSIGKLQSVNFLLKCAFNLLSHSHDYNYPIL